MYEVIEIINARPYVRYMVVSLEAAQKKLEEIGVAFMEVDSDYPTCADAFMLDGRVLSIQPRGFKLNKVEEYTKTKERANERDAYADAFDEKYL
jgi:hypothetical protein